MFGEKVREEGRRGIVHSLHLFRNLEIKSRRVRVVRVVAVDCQFDHVARRVGRRRKREIVRLDCRRPAFPRLARDRHFSVDEQGDRRPADIPIPGLGTDGVRADARGGEAQDDALVAGVRRVAGMAGESAGRDRWIGRAAHERLRVGPWRRVYAEARRCVTLRRATLSVDSQIPCFSVRPVVGTRRIRLGVRAVPDAGHERTLAGV